MKLIYKIFILVTFFFITNIILSAISSNVYNGYDSIFFSAFAKELSVSNISENDELQENKADIKKIVEDDDCNFEAKIAIVDVESILERSEALSDIKKSINSISEKIQQKLSEEEIKLKKLETRLIEKRGKIKKEEFENLMMDFNKQVSQTQNKMQKQKSALERAHTVAVDEVQKNIVAVISDLSKKYRFNIALPSSQVIFVTNHLNITHEVISNLNERLKTVQVDYDINDIEQEKMEN